jgi:hypothetical protein
MSHPIQIDCQLVFQELDFSIQINVDEDNSDDSIDPSTQEKFF